MPRKNANGEKIPTVMDAATYLNVSTKTINDWIKKGIIPKPPTVAYGAGYMNTFPSEYLITAEIALQMHRESKISGNNGQASTTQSSS